MDASDLLKKLNMHKSRTTIPQDTVKKGAEDDKSALEKFAGKKIKL